MGRIKQGIYKKCIVCGNEFYIRKSHDYQKTCSKKCGYIIITKHQIGKNNPNWLGGKMSICEVCGKEFWQSPSRIKDGRKRCSRKCAVIAQIGEGNPRWLGGISFEPYGAEFNNRLKEKIREKFNRKCFECGYPEKQLGYKLHIHHLDYNKKNNSEDNLIPLCGDCHVQTNFKRSDWLNYFNQKLWQMKVGE